jgi:hypothetical protein
MPFTVTIRLADLLNAALDALDESRFADCFDALERYCRSRDRGEPEPYRNADRRARDAWAELSLAAAPGEAWRLTRAGR